MRIAIVGGIGAGKSTVLHAAKMLGISTLSADEINDNLIKEEDYIAKIASEFPEAVNGGRIDKRALADIIFNNSEARLKLNSIAHPLILERIKADTSDPLVVEMPLLLECGAVDMFDEIVLVRTSKRKRVQRLKRRSYGNTFLRKRIYAQGSDKRLKAVATRVLKNNGKEYQLVEKAKTTFEEILKNNNKRSL